MGRDPSPEEVAQSLRDLLVPGETLEFSWVFQRRTDNYHAVTSHRVIFPKLLRDGFMPTSVPFRQISLLSKADDALLVVGAFGAETVPVYNDPEALRRLYDALITKMCDIASSRIAERPLAGDQSYDTVS